VVTRFLITTADQETWKVDQPVLFLGEWCKLYNKKQDWENIDYQVVPYHWDDRLQLFEDYKYLKKFYEDMLLACSDALNKFHGVDHSLRYWRILIGPWLFYFLQTVFDRWQMIDQATKEFELSGSTVLDIELDLIVPQHFSHYCELYVDDLWNHWLYSKILEYVGFSNTIKLPYSRNEAINENHTPSAIKIFIGKGKLFIKQTFNFISNKIKKNDFFFISSYLEPIEQIKLEFSLKQFPTFYFQPKLKPIKFIEEHRKDFKIDISVNKGFEEFASSLISVQIPRYYLEGYKSLVQLTDEIEWPSLPKIIYTSNASIGGDFFKCWAACKTEKGVKLVLGQHGGQYGVGKWVSTEEHELSISNHFITWGWTGLSKKFFPLPASKLACIHKRLTSNSSGGLILAQASAPRYSYWMYSIPVSSQFGDYFNEQVLFANALSNKIRSLLTVRLYPKDYGWGQKARWLNALPDTKFDSFSNSLEESISVSRLFIGTYNSTTFLETFSANVPTIIFWNPAFWELRESAKADYHMLREAGILYDTPESAAKKVEEIWDDVNGWWQQTHIQKARIAFCSKYAITATDWLSQWKNTLKKISQEDI
jgi:putative transferase (TIGR04331 family)